MLDETDPNVEEPFYSSDEGEDDDDTPSGIKLITSCCVLNIVCFKTGFIRPCLNFTSYAFLPQGKFKTRTIKFGCKQWPIFEMGERKITRNRIFHGRGKEQIGQIFCVTQYSCQGENLMIRLKTIQ